MSGIYDVTFSDRFKEYLSPDKRLPKWMAWVTVFAKPLQWLRDRIYVDYATGASYSFWNNSTTYQFDDIVRYTNDFGEIKVYLCITKIPLGTTAVPTDTKNWLLIQDDIIGADDRIRFSDQKLILEYILNTYLGTTFRNPPLQSDIYITNTPTADKLPYFTADAAQYNNSTLYQGGSLVKKGAFYFVALQSTTGNAPPNTPVATSYWYPFNMVRPYRAGDTYVPGQVVYYKTHIFMNYLGSTGVAPPSTNTFNSNWTPILGVSTTNAVGFQINIPAAAYNALGASSDFPNKADVTIQRLVRKYTFGYMFEIIPY